MMRAPTRLPRHARVLRGFTLIETLIAVALTVLIMAAIGELYFVYSNAIANQTAVIRVTRGVDAVVSVVRTAGLQADRIVTTHDFSGTSYDSGSTGIVFELPAVDTSGTTVASAYDYIGVIASGTDAYQFTDAAAGSARHSGTKLLTDTLQALSYSYGTTTPSEATSVVVDATTSATVNNHTVQEHLNGVVYLRNL